MNILLTNDDGINGKGLAVLAEKLSFCADVYILAPDSNRSGVSHCIMMDTPLLLTKHGEKKYSSSGCPVDCVVTGLASDLFGVKFDAVFAGINKGANMGTDIVYSGTVAAARQAVLYGVPGVAFSLDSEDDYYDYGAIASFAADNCKTLAGLSCNGMFVNVNALSSSSYNDVSFSTLCRRDYRDKVKITRDADGKIYSSFSGGDIFTDGKNDCDFFSTRKGKIAVSVISAEPVHEESFRCEFEKIEFKL